MAIVTNEVLQTSSDIAERELAGAVTRHMICAEEPHGAEIRKLLHQRADA